ncbi:hypothetical protein OpiT1DRAFT_02888 [Opitutaceae bacterium TAV1]|nr:hypothetical protein OpiT1DRAFT_02888 [Opitutaceae bacterium TAV1]
MKNHFAIRRCLSLLVILAACGLSGGCMGTNATVERKLEAYDTDGDGYLSLAEFRNTLVAARSGDPVALFRSIDTDGDGKITVSEIKAHRIHRDPNY